MKRAEWHSAGMHEKILMIGSLSLGRAHKKGGEWYAQWSAGYVNIKCDSQMAAKRYVEELSAKWLRTVARDLEERG